MKVKEDKISNIKRIVLTTINYIAGILCMYSICAFDIESYIPMIVFILSFSWLILMAAINGLFDWW